MLLLIFSNSYGTATGYDNTYDYCSSINPDVLDRYVDGTLTERSEVNKKTFYTAVEINGAPSDTFETSDGKTVTVVNGIITNIV